MAEYIKTIWEDHLVDVITEEVIQEGTRFTAKRMNNIEEGIYTAHDRLDKHDNSILRLMVLLDLEGRAPGNNGTFADSFNGQPNKIAPQTARTTLTAPRAAGTTVLNVENTEGFQELTEVTLYDGDSIETRLITNVTASTITVQPLQNDYTKGAMIARSNAVAGVNGLTKGSWGTYSISVSGVV